jgi:hypothetical protein
VWDFCNCLHNFELGNTAGLIFRCHWASKLCDYRDAKDRVLFFHSVEQSDGHEQQVSHERQPYPLHVLQRAIPFC